MASDSLEERKSAASALGYIRSTRAIPILIDLLRQPDAAERFIGWEGEVHETELHYAGQALVRIGIDAIPSLIDGLQDNELRGEIVGVLSELGPDAVKALLNSLQDTDASRRESVGYALADIAVMDESLHERTMVAFETALHDPVDAVRAMAAYGLDVSGPLADRAIPGLIARLKDPDPGVRRAAALALGTKSASAVADLGVVDALLELLEDQDPDVRNSGLVALARIGPVGRSAVPTLIRALKDGATCEMAAEALGEIGANSSGVLEGLRDLLDSENPDTRRAAERAMEKLRNGL